MSTFLGIPYGPDHPMSPMEYEIYHNPIYTIGAAFFAGILFSPWSFGIIYYLLFLIIWELLFYGWCNYKNVFWNWQIRLSIVLAALFGFLLGRTMINEDDHAGSVKEFKCRMNRYLKNVGWIKDDDKNDKKDNIDSDDYINSEDTTDSNHIVESSLISSSVYDSTDMSS